MNMAIVFGIVTLVILWYNLFISNSIVNYLNSNGYQVSLFRKGFFVKGKIFKYLPLYKEVSFKKEGKVGRLYYLFYFSLIGVFLFLLLGLLSVSK